MPTNQELIPRGAVTFSRDLTETKSLQCRDFTWALHMEKSLSPLFPCPRGDVVANDWCIKFSFDNFENIMDNGALLQKSKCFIFHNIFKVCMIFQRHHYGIFLDFCNHS